jgi:hypothetical protein
MQLLQNFENLIINPLILLIFAAGFFLFTWGLVQFILNLDNESGRQDGVRHMLWGIAGMFIMVAVYGIIGLLNNTFDLGLKDRAGGGFEPTINLNRLPSNLNYPSVR